DYYCSSYASGSTYMF
nr:immunoglobulin light chain junction region [Macaca mulatta]MOY15141.1 immunoglobulin light chain junction region [Macaca mulatta]MOY15391.1 immunoglobulin light chain junction region [Macaca mulatta]MOY15437.1 immunoglobulin light chain junction region [Macaca mulatta]MOY15502.1 immunoglobulin light chain junction region [Macaca mulatta]